MAVARMAQKWWIENMVYPCMERYRGNRIREQLGFLQEMDRAGQGAQRAQQELALRRLLLFCGKRVPAYRDVLASADMVERDVWSALAAVPILSKEEFRDHPERYLAEGWNPASRIPNETGGSTGIPLHFFMDRQQVESYEAARWRGLSWYGITPGSRSVMVWGPPSGHSAAKRLSARWKERYLKNRRIISAYDLSPDRGEAYIRLLNRYHPEYLYGYAGALYTLATILEGEQERLRLDLRAVVSTAETLHPWQREKIQSVFSAPVVNEYGARDAGILAYECPCGGLHLTVENAVVEILDPVTHDPVPPGQPGVLAVTDLHNFVQPRLRYLLGDYGSLSTAPCPCGRSSPVFRRLEGREDALLLCRNGRLVHGNVVNQLLRPHPWLRQFRLVQHTPETATLFLVMAPDPGREASLRRQVEAVLPGVVITTRIVDTIPPTPSGKSRYTIREFPLHP